MTAAERAPRAGVDLAAAGSELPIRRPPASVSETSKAPLERSPWATLPR